MEGQTEIIPDFEHKVFEMDLHIEGKIRLLYLFLFAFHMLMDKNVRITVTHLKKIKVMIFGSSNRRNEKNGRQ